MENLRKKITELIESRGHVDTEAFDRLRSSYSASPIEIASEIDRVLKADARLAAKHRLAGEVLERARSSDSESLLWLNDYRDRAASLGWNRVDLVALVDSERPAARRAVGESGTQSARPGADADSETPKPLSNEQPAGGNDPDHVTPTEPAQKAASEAVDDDEFPIKQMTLGVAAILVALVIMAVVFLGDGSPRVNPAEQSAWARAEDRASVQGYRTFIDQWPNSERVERARDRLASLLERQSAAREQAANDQRGLVRQAQRYLAILGYEVEPSGDMGENTARAITAFEEAQGLPSRGVVDPGLLRALEDAWRMAEDDIWRRAQAEGTTAAVTRYLRAYPEGRHTTAARQRLERFQSAAERRELIESIQRELVRLGRDVEISGVADARTADEIRDYRESTWQALDGPLDQSLLADLRDLQQWPPQPGETFVDCSTCPAMVVIPGGDFVMGSSPDEPMRSTSEGPQRRVTVPRFALARTEVTFDQYRSCVEAGACSYLPPDEGWGQGTRPVINVSMEDAGIYVRWLSKVSGRRYRLPSEAEWEYAARGGTATRFYTGRCLNSLQANFDARRPIGDCPEGAQVGKTLPVGSFAPNPFGLFDMLGNVQEWTLDCWNPSYEGAPSDGSPWIEGDCSRAVLRGGSWRNAEGKVRSASRARPAGAFHNDHTGFRPALSLEP